MPTKNNINKRINWAKEVMLKETEAIERTARSLEENFSNAIDLLAVVDQKVIVTGIGKSGHQAKRIAALLCSTGTPAAFLHPAEAVHGDLGIHQKGDPVIFLSNSGSTPELIFLEPIIRARGSKIVGILGKIPSKLSEKVDVAIDASVSKEADPLGIVPTSSCSVAGALADAIASVLMREKQFTESDYANTHPAGQLGRNLLLSVGDVMQTKEKIAIVEKGSKINDILLKMTEHPLGAACVMEDNILVGLITEGDIRRTLQLSTPISEIKAADMMNSNFITAEPDLLLGEALKLMEDRDSPISVLPVVPTDTKDLLGLIRLHDIYS